ncbi:MAG: alpha/beta hydrolase [Pirellula sp.]
MSRRLTSTFLIVCVCILTQFASSTAQEKATKPTGPYRLEKDIAYRSADNQSANNQSANNPGESKESLYRSERCKLDVYIPTDKKDFSTVVWFHGGGLTKGNKAIPDGLKEKGIGVIAANYRLSPQADSPAYIEDAAAAVAWVFQNIERYGGSRKRIFVSGHSAGGYLTSMIGLDKQWLAQHQLDANDIAGLIPFSGQSITHFTIRKERGIDEKQPIVDNLAPLFHVRKDAPPILFISGDREKEMVGRYEETAYMWRMLKEVGHTNVELLELQGYDHGGMAEPGFPLLLQFVKKWSHSVEAK